MSCPVCGKKQQYTSPVNVILFEVPDRAKPYRLWSDEDYLLCAGSGCSSVLRFIERAIDSHAEARQAVGNNWTRVRILFDNLDGWLITQNPRAMAQA